MTCVVFFDRRLWKNPKSGPPRTDGPYRRIAGILKVFRWFEIATEVKIMASQIAGGILFPTLK
jgi:hypothetical protein